MVKEAKANGGFISQKNLQDGGKIRIRLGYIHCVRPLLKPQCDFILVTKNGSQHSKLGDEMSKFVSDPIGKYIHPTSYRQIVETQSLHALNDKSIEFCLKTKNIAL